MVGPDRDYSRFSRGSRVWSLCLCLIALIAARAEQLPVRNYSTADGLGSSAINHITRDSRGFLWFCTSDGLSRFDGVHFTTYDIGQDPSHPTINYILETSRRVYLIATSGGGIYRFDPNDVSERNGSGGEKDKRLTLNAEKISDTGATALYEDSAGNLWAAADGLYHLEATEDRLLFHRTELNIPERSKETVAVLGFKEARDGSLWLNAGDSAIRRLPDARTIQYLLPLGWRDTAITVLEEDREGRIWIGHRKGFYVLNPETLASLSAAGQYTKRLLPLRSRNTDNFASHLSRLRAGDAVYFEDAGRSGAYSATGLLQTADGQMWLANDKGLIVFDGEGRHSFRNTQGIAGNDGGTLAEDIEGNVWVGNRSGGVKKILRNGITTFDSSDGLGHLRIRAIGEDNEGEMFVVNGDFLISRLEGKEFKTVRPNLTAEVFSVWTSIGGGRDAGTEWWVHARSGLFRFSDIRRLEELARKKPDIHTQGEGPKNFNPFRVFEDRGRDIWISTRAESGLTKWQRSTDSFHVFAEPEGLPSQLIPSAFAQDMSGNIYMGFYEGGLARYADGRFTVFSADAGAPPGEITGLYFDREDRLWIASSTGGLSRVDDPSAPHPKFETYTTGNGLSSDNVRCIVDDLPGNIYAGTVRGIDRLDPASGNIHHYGLGDGLAGDLVSSAYRDREGALWFGTPQGLTRLKPELERVRTAPPILISGLRIAGVKRPVSELGQWKIDVLELDYTQNNLEVDFFSLDFALGENIRYQFKLEGADSDWSKPTTQRTVNYPNIAPGDYRFLVRAVNPAGAASASPAFVPFTIVPPIWRRWWFLTLGALSLFALVYAFYRYRLTKLLAIERTRVRIATDLHDDIGASLSRIAMLSEVVKRQNGVQNQDSATRLTQIAENARDLVDSMSDIVWSIDPRGDSISSVLERVRSFADDTLGGSGVKWGLETEPELSEIYLSSEQRRGLYLILKEAVTNIARHANCENATISISFNHMSLIAEISDDGGGLPKDSDRNSRGGHGLENMKARATELGGEFEICSSNDGTQIVLILPRSKTRSIDMLFQRWFTR